MPLVDQLVVRRSGAALVDAEKVLLGNIYKCEEDKDKRTERPEEKVASKQSHDCSVFRQETKKHMCYYFFLLLEHLPGLS